MLGIAIRKITPKKDHYQEAGRVSVGLAGALGQAINNLCLSIDMEDARTILALVCAPKDAITMSALAEISKSVEDRSPHSVVRIGDYPRRGKEISITLILSNLTAVRRMEGLFDRAEDLLSKQQEIEKEAEQKTAQMHARGDKIPTLDQ